MSYVSQQFLLADNTSLANFKNWAQAISVALSSSGWTQTADTGQVNWSTIVSVPTSGNFVYEVWQPADALQTGSTKFYLKIKYGTSSGSPAGPRLQLQLGTGTDGAGNLTGFTTTNYEAGNTAWTGQGTVTSDCYFSGDVDRFTFMMWRSLNTNQAFPVFSIERTHNTDGTNSSDGVSLFLFDTSAVTSGFNVIVFGVGVNTLYNALHGASFAISTFACNNSSGAFNNNIPISPIFPEYGKTGNPLTTLALCHQQDVAEGCIFTTTLYGATRTYIRTKQQLILPSNNPALCMRYD